MLPNCLHYLLVPSIKNTVKLTVNTTECGYSIDSKIDGFIFHHIKAANSRFTLVVEVQVLWPKSMCQRNLDMGTIEICLNIC